MNTVPEHVERFVQTHVESLHDLRRRFDSVFALEKTLGAGGRYVWEAWTQDSIQSQLRAAQDGLNTFRSLARDNGVEPEALINSLGGEPSFSDCEQTATQFHS
jgi:hypothetical protein